MDDRLRQRVERLAGRKPVFWQAVRGGYTPAERWRIGFADGSFAFAKVGTTPYTASYLRVEARRYAELGPRSEFMARFFGFEDDAERPLLLLEDLSAARWPPPWQTNDIERLREML